MAKHSKGDVVRGGFLLVPRLIVWDSQSGGTKEASFMLRDERSDLTIAIIR